MKEFNKISIFVLSAMLVIGVSGTAQAATSTVNLGTATNFAILAGTGITNVPTSVITGNVGLSPAAGSNYAGLTKAEVTGTIYDVNGAGPAGSVNNPALMTTAKNDLTAAFLDTAGRTPVTTVASELGGTTLTDGVYDSEDTTFQITSGAGTLTLDGQGDSSSVFIFKMGAEGPGLTVGSASVVSLINGASACNVFWEVDTAVINTTAVFKGNVLALNSITVASGANIEGRLLARNGNVTLDHNVIAIGVCGIPTLPTVITPAVVLTALPATGADSSQNNNLWYMIAIVGLTFTSISYLVYSRKRI